MTAPAPDQDPARDPTAGPPRGPARDPVALPAAATAPAQRSGPLTAPAGKRHRTAAWRAWRGRRPFAGGVLVTLAGTEILLTEKAPLPVVVHIGMEGLAGYLVPAVLLVCGVLILFNPAQRLFYSILAVLLSLGSWITSNLGGFLLGLLFGVLGSCLSFGWLPDQQPRRGLLRRYGMAPSPAPPDS